MLFEKTNAKQVGLYIRSRYIDRRGLFVFAAVLITMLTAGLAVHSAYADTSNVSKSGKHVLTVHDSGAVRGILTESETLREALAAADIKIGEHDVTEPALDDRLVAASYDVNIYRARPVAVHDEGVVTKVMTPHYSATQIAKQAGVTLQDEDDAKLESSPDVVSDGAIERLVIDRSTEFTLIFYGKKTTEYTRAGTVAELLSEKGITLSGTDRISPKTTAKLTAGMTVDIWREGKQTVTREESVDFPTRKIDDADQKVGYRKVTTPGVEGEKLVTYEIVVKNGREISRRAIKTVVTKKPVEQVEVVGTKNNYSGSLNEWLTALRTCETGGNYQSNTGNGYYGAYQFLPSTWNSIARMSGRDDLVGVMPHQATPGDQDAMVVANANATAGLSTQHPGCYQKLGLANKPPQ